MMNNTQFTFQQNTSPQLIPIQLVSMPQVPQLVVPQILSVPQPSNLPAYTLLPNTISNQPVKFWDEATQSVTECPAAFAPQPTLNNQLIAPFGFSFVLMNVPQQASVSDSGSASVERSVSARSEVNLTAPPAKVVSISREATPEPQKRKYKHRSKQERIEQVHREVQEKYTALGLYAAEDEVLRGFDTIRVHVKTYRGLNVVNQPLDRIMNDPSIHVLKIATPFSMKNKFQKKGFIIYLKLADERQVPMVQAIFKDYEEYFPKCDIALKKEDKLRLDALKAQEACRSPKFLSQMANDCSKLDSWDDAFDLDLAPPSMKRTGSLSSIAA